MASKSVCAKPVTAVLYTASDIEARLRGEI